MTNIAANRRIVIMFILIFDNKFYELDFKFYNPDSSPKTTDTFVLLVV